MSAIINTATVSQLRDNLADSLKDLAKNPLLVLSRGKQVAVMLDPEIYETMAERIEDLEDILIGRIALGEIEANDEKMMSLEEARAELEF